MAATKKVLFIEWDSFGNSEIIRSFKKLDLETENYRFDRDHIDARLDGNETEKIAKKILSGNYFFVFSFNYFPIVAIACKACKVPYISWTYDSPFVMLFSETINYETNFPFVFDRGAVEELKAAGLNAEYLPMATDDSGFDSAINKNKKDHYEDIAFVGSMYTEDEDSFMYKKYREIPEHAKGFLKGLAEAQKKVYGYNFATQVLRENPMILDEIRKTCPVYDGTDTREDAAWTVFNYFLSRDITAMERKEIIDLISERHEVALYTGGIYANKSARVYKPVGYNTEAPSIYKNSKINLNITRKSIITGIPLRCFDIMGSGGFLISNYQSEIPEYFEPDKDICLYSDYEELAEKTDFYLIHEEIRKKIA
ncbi:MAG: glycosyltransferase, partial [Succinivibrio sp.]|nr:glycosyltransferase [Succinivibrio sp.]